MCRITRRCRGAVGALTCRREHAWGRSPSASCLIAAVWPCLVKASERRRNTAAKHGGKGVRGWKKLHLAVDQGGVIVGQELSEAAVDDGRVGVELVDRVPGKIRKVIGDGAYDSRALYDVARPIRKVGRGGSRSKLDA